VLCCLLGLVTLNEMKAKQEDVVKERERQMVIGKEAYLPGTDDSTSTINKKSHKQVSMIWITLVQKSFMLGKKLPVDFLVRWYHKSEIGKGGGQKDHRSISAQLLSTCQSWLYFLCSVQHVPA